MPLPYKTRRRLSLTILVLGLPVYIIVALTVVNWLDRPHILVELAIYVALGVCWAFPLRKLFLGIGRPDPDAPEKD